MTSPRSRTTQCTTGWASDLYAVKRGELPFDVLVRRHNRYVERVARSYSLRCPPSVSAEDLWQELWTEVALSIRSWDETRAPLDRHVGYRMTKRMLYLNKIRKRQSQRDQRYAELSVITECVVRTPSEEGGSGYAVVCQPSNDTQCDAVRLAKLVVGGMPNARAQNLVAKVLVGVPIEQAANEAFGERCTRPKKAAYRALAHALRLVDQQDDLDPQPHEEIPHADREKARLRPLRKINEPHLSQGQQADAG